MSGGNLLCEYCDHPLGLFKRKRMCPGCSRWFCTTCLPRDYQFQASNLRLGRNPLGPTPICQRCSILAIDNVTKEHLMELRVKDLRQYLETKRIPTAGCREKSELVDLVFSHCCSDAFLRQQAENQRRLRELTRRKEAEEQWEERHGRSQNDLNSPDSVGSGRRFNSRVASSSPETSSGADDPDEVSIGEEIQVDPPDSQPPSSSSRLNRDDADLGAAAAQNDAWRPVYEVVDVEFSNRAGDRMDIGTNGGDIPSPTANGAPQAPSAPVAPPSYDEVMASTSSSSNGVHPASAGATETIDLTQSSETDDAIEVEAAPSSASRTRGANTLISEATTASTTTTTTASSSNGTSPTTDSAAGSGVAGGGTATSASTTSSTLHPPHVSNASSAANSGTDSLSSSPSRFAGRRRIRLEELERPEDIKELTPRQLKEILTANFVAYKGCCERWELEDRVKRLWNEYRVNQEVLRQTYEREENRNGTGSGEGGGANASVSPDPASSGSGGASSSTTTTASTSTSHPHHHPDVDSQLCKICWDAVIDCVLLECGHMVTCTDCGRRMAECPICRQYVVRAVHVFRA